MAKDYEEPKQLLLKTPVQVAEYRKVANYRAEHQAFAIHKIPLPVKKVVRNDDLITGSLSRKPALIKEKTKREYYPATYQNRFAVWWNDKVDKVFGSSGRPKPVLVDVKKYRQYRKELSNR